MNTVVTSGRRKYLLPTLVLILAALLGGLFLLKHKLESDAEKRVMDELDLFSQAMRLDNAEVTVSLLSSSIDVRNLVYTLNDFPVTVKIGKISQKGIDRDTLMGKPGPLSRIDKTVMENLEVFLERTDDPLEEPILSCEYYEVNNYEYAHRDFVATLRKHRGGTDVRGLLAELLPLVASSTSGANSGRNFRIQYHHGDGNFLMTIAEAESSGISRLIGETGYDSIIQNARYGKFSFSYSNEYSSSISVRLDEYRLQTYKFSSKEILEILSDLLQAEGSMELLAAILKCGALHYSMEMASMRNFSGSCAEGLLEAEFTVDEITFHNNSFTESGPELWRNLQVNLNKQKILELEEAGLDKTLITGAFLMDFLRDPMPFMNWEKLEELLENPYELFKGTRLENFYLKNMTFTHPAGANAQPLLTLDLWRMDLDMGDNANFKSQVQNLFLSRELLGFATWDVSLPDNMDGLTLDADLNLDARIADTLDLVMTLSLNEKNLGNFKLAVDALQAKNSSFPLPYLRKLELFLADRGFSDALFSYLAWMDDLDDPEEARQMILDKIDEAIEDFDGAEQMKLNFLALRALVAEGGSLQLVCSPSRPIPLYALWDFLDDPEGLNLSIKHTAP
ncbi:MAG: hypothetical protein FWG17_05530 [Desulfovibrionaceae bacterium]|nr:hypothetical protein [Desulfovibrionaceae bacterium]